jgi:hypothetical protein
MTLYKINGSADDIKGRKDAFIVNGKNDYDSSSELHVADGSICSFSLIVRHHRLKNVSLVASVLLFFLLPSHSSVVGGGRRLVVMVLSLNRLWFV